MQYYASVLYPEDMKIEVTHDNEKPVDEYDCQIAVRFCRTASINLSLQEAEELASKLESCIQDYRISVLKEIDIDKVNPFEMVK